MRLHLRSLVLLALAACAVPSVADASATSYYRLVQYPGAASSDYGFAGVHGQTAAAKKSIDMEMYELTDRLEENELAAAAKRGVTVRVLLDRDFSGGTVNRPAYTYLHSHGVAVRWGPAGYIFHIKAITFDRRTSDVSTANLTSKYYADTRDAMIIDTNPAQVAAIDGTFARDWGAAPGGKPGSQTVQAAGLVWSPNTGTGTAQDAMVAEIRAAKSSVFFTSEELSDPAVYDALGADAERGVHCQIVMTESSEWSVGFTAARRSGCQVHVFPDSSSALYIHEKIVLDDAGSTRASMLIGSQNAGDYSLTRNRELSLLLTDRTAHAVIASVASTFDRDFANASAWQSGTSTGTSGGGSVTTPTPTGACSPRTSSGNCYSAGEFCSDAEHGESGIAKDGEAIVCEENGSYWRWEPK
jgi:phosphatidylserine/phosphatidylglycerophosphate/cardiolipin synthase-like enzyme